MNRTREHMKRFGEDPGFWNAHVEMNPEETGYHAHITQHGTQNGGYINRDALDQAAFRAGAGLTRVRQIKVVGSLAAYGLKGAGMAAYGMKGASDGAEYLRLNGGRLGHHSQGFFRSPSGATLPVRVAERNALKAVYGGEEGEWRLVTDSSARSWASLKPVTSPALVTRELGTLTGG
jgi:hypothetical protein